MATAGAGYHHRAVQQARRLHLKKHRLEERCFLIEGPLLVAQALESSAPIRSAFIEKRAPAPVASLTKRIAGTGASVFSVDSRTVAALSETRSPQGIVAVVGFVDRPVSAISGIVADHEATLLLVLHDLGDPGNAGTLVRCAHAFRAGAVCFGPTAVEPYNAKVVRASAGAFFRVPIVRYESWAQLRAELQRCGARMLAADAGGDDIRTVQIPKRCALLVGHERHGLSALDPRDIERRVAVPQSPAAESLNAGVAGAILMYQIAAANALL